MIIYINLSKMENKALPASLQGSIETVQESSAIRHIAYLRASAVEMKWFHISAMNKFHPIFATLWGLFGL